MQRQLSVDFNRAASRDVIHGNARHACPGTRIEVGARVVVGDDDWGVAEAEIVRHDPETGALLLRITGDLQPELPPLSRTERA